MNYYFAFGKGQPSVNSGLSPTFIAFINSAGSSFAPPGISAIGTSLGIYTFAYGTSSSIAFVIDGATTGLTSNDRYIFGAIDPSNRIAEYGTSILAFGATAVALGTTNMALGTTNVALGTTNVALGTTAVALGITNVALGITGVAYDASIFALGTTAVALGTTNFALGTTNVALGTTNIALGTSVYAYVQNEGATIIAIGNTLIGIGNTVGVIGITLDTVLLSIGSTASSFGSTSTDPVDLYGYLKRIQEFLEGNQVYTKVSGIWDIYSRGSSTLLREKTLTNSVSTVIKT